MTRPSLSKFIPLGLIFLLLAILMPRNSKFAYDYRKGREWKYETLFAEFDFPIYKTAEQIREELSSSTERVVPYYRFSSVTMNRSLTAAQGKDLGKLKNAVVSELRSLYTKGIVQDESRKQKDDIPQSDISRGIRGPSRLLLQKSTSSRRRKPNCYLTWERCPMSM